MSENVVSLSGGVPTGMVNQELVELLESLTERAKSGEIVALAYAGYDGQELIISGWETGYHTLMMSAAVATLNARYQNHIVNEE